MRIFRTIPMPFVKEERAANHTSYVYAVGTSLPVETQDRRQSDSAEAYMAFPKMLHSCLACLQWKNPDAGNYSTRQCAAIREHDTLPER
jgi:hypothetical protein